MRASALFGPRVLTGTNSMVLPMVLGIQPAEESPHAIHQPPRKEEGIDNENNGFERNIDLPFTTLHSRLAIHGAPDDDTVTRRNHLN